MKSNAQTVEQYLAALPADRRATIEAVRRVIRANLDRDYEEGMSYGMICYCVPHRVYPPGYHCNPAQPLPFAGLASQKNHMSVYLMPVYGQDEAWFRTAWKKTGKKLDMGKCCVRFKKLEDVALDVIGEAIRRMPVRKWIETYEKTILTKNRRAAAARGKPASAAKRATQPIARKKTIGKAPASAKKTVRRAKPGTRSR